MVVSVADVITVLNGSVAVPGTSYYIYGHIITSAAISAIITDITACENASWDAGVLTANPTLIDMLIKYEAAMEVMGIDVMGQLMQSGVTYSILQLSVSKGGAFTEQTTNVINSLMSRWNRIRHILQDDVDSDANMDMGEDFWTGLDQFSNDTIPI